MGKLKDEVSSSKPSEPNKGAKKSGMTSKGKPGGAPPGQFTLFLLNLARADRYKPMQGWYARLYTALGLGLIAATGAWRVYESSIEYQAVWRICLPAIFAAVLGWVIFRLIHFPPFAEFLIATEAEMNKVSWTNKEDLFRATTVVLTTVVIMTVFLFLVDTLWTALLRLIGVLQFGGSGGFGSTA
jgi:preprotein translocase subunit SecE